MTKGKQSIKGGKDEPPKSGKSADNKIKKSEESKQIFTKMPAPVLGNKASFFQSSPNNLSIVEGMEACLLCHIQERWIDNEDYKKAL